MPSRQANDAVACMWTKNFQQKSRTLLCTVDEIFSLLKSLDVSKANGPDGISARMLKFTAHAIAPSLTRLFNISIRFGRFPTCWKASLVVPVPKSSKPSRSIKLQADLPTACAK